MLKRLDNHLFKYYKGVIRGLTDHQPQIRGLEYLPKPGLACVLDVTKRSSFSLNTLKLVIPYIWVCIIPRLEQIKKEGEQKSFTTPIMLITMNMKRERNQNGKRMEKVKCLQKKVNASALGMTLVILSMLSQDCVQVQIHKNCMLIDPCICQCYDGPLWYLIHNTSSDGTFFFPTASKKLKWRLLGFPQLGVCQVMLREMPLSTFQDIC